MHIQNLVDKFGPWQKYNLLTAGLVFFAIAMQHTSMPFLAPRNDHWCAPPDNLKSVTVSRWKNFSLPKNDDGMGFSACSQYAFDYGNLTEYEYYEAMETFWSSLDEAPPTKQCSRWTFNQTFWHRSIITEVSDAFVLFIYMFYQEAYFQDKNKKCFNNVCDFSVIMSRLIKNIIVPSGIWCVKMPW